MREVPEAGVLVFFDQARPLIDETLDAILPATDDPPRRLHDAMRYSVFAGGKRLRPMLCLAAYRAFRSEWQPALGVAAALELIHTYSLIHDDLPAMDDDDVRRGQPSCHRKFDEATAILAGDALLTLAFGVLMSETGFPADLMRNVAGRIARAAGSSGGMIAGQVMDLEAEGQDVSPDTLEAIHRAKTGALVEVSLVSGALLGGAGAGEVEAIGRFGRAVGLAFQVRDDLLDEIAEGAALGKTPGKDARQGKATYTRQFGQAESRRMIQRLNAQAREALAILGERGALLTRIADRLESRTR